MMRVLPPMDIGQAQLVSTSVAAEDATPVWAAATAWAKDALCHRVETHMVYRRITAGTSPTPPEGDAALWQALRPTNRRAMFNLLHDTRTRVEGGPLTVTLAPGQRVDSLALVGLTGASATVRVAIGADVLERSFPLLTRRVRSWYQYFTAPFVQQGALTLWDLPPYRGATITVTITPNAAGPAGVAECGRLILGMGARIGELQWDYENDALNFSRIERNFDGSLAAIEQRRSVPTNALPVRVDAADVDAVLALRARLNAVPALWSGWTRYPDSPYASSALLFGIYRRFAVRPANKRYAQATLEIEEM
ncbi:hypothetical protein SAMN05428957_10895 [Oryzisolibacter propanilivorax]|uniref:Uncharacterized protein n=1 Tax=Oryzisolibacter propanilivorax TaxID=1527607 RepID=A0A1G9UBT0_9BURK|nr:hypothetical protein [Oryzisolibacter propanilivorax]SDM57411.1 hypothetical protein SAMN05428957_10895 [Oryzisolibacter propanilivorax]